MPMQIINHLQGSPEWVEHRNKTFNASDAPAMLNCSPHKTRAQLLREYAGAEAKQIYAPIAKNGHAFEALGRELAEKRIGEDLMPVTGITTDFNLPMPLGASFDGLTMMQDDSYEHKSMNDEIRKAQTVEELPLRYRVQMDQQLLVSGGNRCLFMASNWKGDKLVESKEFWYYPNLELADQILEGWKQFYADLQALKESGFTPATEKPIANHIEAIPTLSVVVSGAVDKSNFPAVKLAARKFLDEINTVLKTDEDFANAEATVKFCDATEKRFEATKAAIIAQTESIDEIISGINAIQGELKAKRLFLNKAVTEQKAGLKQAAISDARHKFFAHIATLEAETTPIRLGAIDVDFDAAAKNKRTLQSLYDAMDAELNKGIMAANKIAQDYREKLGWIKEEHKGYGFLFNDLQVIIVKPMDDFKLLANTRFKDHKEAEEKRLEAEREKMRIEEEAKAQAKVAAEQQAASPVADAATTPEAIQTPAPAQPQARTGGGGGKAAKRKPTRTEIVDLVATHWDVSVSTARTWLRAEFAGEQD